MTNGKLLVLWDQAHDKNTNEAEEPNLVGIFSSLEKLNEYLNLTGYIEVNLKSEDEIGKQEVGSQIVEFWFSVHTLDDFGDV